MVGNFAVKNFSKALDEEFDIPFDVELSVNTNVSDDDRKGSVAEMISCHKIVMALSSPVFAKLFYSGKVTPEMSLAFDGELVTMKDMDPDVMRLIIQFCYNKKLELSSKALVFLVNLYITAAKFEISDLQELIVKQKVMYKIVIDEDVVPEEEAWDIIDLALKHKEHPKLLDCLFSKATVILILIYNDRSDELVPRLRKKLHDENIIQLLLQKLGLDDMCRNCKKFCCMDRQDVTERNFVPGARVKIKNPRSSRGNPALVSLGQLDPRTRLVTGLTVSGVPVPASRFQRNVYIFDCSQHFD